jgi:hypothetical protein
MSVRFGGSLTSNRQEPRGQLRAGSKWLQASHAVCHREMLQSLRLSIDDFHRLMRASDSTRNLGKCAQTIIRSISRR